MDLSELGPVVPGHPLYAQVRAERIFTDALTPTLGLNANDAALSLIARLAHNEPPILLLHSRRDAGLALPSGSTAPDPHHPRSLAVAVWVGGTYSGKDARWHGRSTASCAGSTLN